MKQKSFCDPDVDSYGYARRFRECTNDELIEAVNCQVRIPVWITAKADYVCKLRLELLSHDLDCDSFCSYRIIDNTTYDTMCIAKRLRLEGNKILI